MPQETCEEDAFFFLFLCSFVNSEVEGFKNKPKPHMINIISNSHYIISLPVIYLQKVLFM